jgi:hypothetical protein
MRPHKDHPQSGLVDERITDVGRALADAFTGVLEAIPGGPHRPQWLARSLGVNTVLTSRILKATQQHDPFAVAHMIPGPEPLRRLLQAANKRRVDRKLIKNANDAVDRFQQLIDAEAGDRSALDAIISGWLPDAREQVELLAKQSAFRGVSHLLGTASEAAHYTFILFPSLRRLGRADELVIFNTRGLRRLRRGFIVNYDTVHAGSSMLTVTGDPVDALDGLLLEQFCSKPLPQLHVVRDGAVAQYTVAGQEVGVRSAVDLVHATYLPEKREVQLQPGEAARKANFAMGIDTPTKLFLFDVLLHKDIFPGRQPDLSLFRTAGVFGSPPTARRDMDRLDVSESVQALGQGLGQFRSADTPAHQEMLQFVCEKRGWDPSLLCGFRCRIDYPMYSSEISLEFDVPQS